MTKLKILFVFCLAFLLGLFSRNLVTYVLAHGGDLNLIHACVRTSSGAIRIVSPTTTCSSNETALDWRISPKPGTELPFIFNGNLTPGMASKLIGGDLSNAVIESSQLLGLSLSNTNFSSADLNSNTIEDTDFSGSNFTNANLTSSFLTNINFTDANLIGAVMTNTTRTNIIWSNTTCPDGTNSNNNGGTCEGHLIP